MSISAQSKTMLIESVGMTPAGRNPEVTVLTDGRFVVVWQEVTSSPADGFVDTDGAVFARIYNADGTADSETIQVNSWQPGVQDKPSVAALADGGFAVSFNSTLIWGDRPTDVDTFVINFDASGNVNPYIDEFGVQRQYRDIDPDNPGAVDTGNFMADAGNGYVAFVREMAEPALARVTLLNPDGSLAGATPDMEFVDRMDQVSGVTRLVGGNVLIAGEISGVVVLRLSDSTLNGAPDGVPGLTAPVYFHTLTAFAGAADIKVTALDPGKFATDGTHGGFVVTALEPNGSTASKLMVESYSAWGTKQGSTVINIAISLNATRPEYDVLALRDGTFVVSWTTKSLNGLDVMAGHFDSNGAPLGAAVVVQGNAAGGDQFDPSLSVLDDGTVIVAFSDVGGSAVNNTTEVIHAVKLTISSTSGGLVATAGADNINGTGGHDYLDGLAGNDTINGLAGNDVILGNDGNDNLVGGFGNDGLIGGIGTDAIAGGDGNDGLAGGAGADTLKGQLGNDALSGGAQSDRLDGGAGNDRLDGGGDNDNLTGGTGADVFVLRHGGGDDVVADFGTTDVLRLDHALWIAEGDLTAAQVLAQFAAVVGTNTVLTFDDGESITLTGFTALVAADLLLF